MKNSLKNKYTLQNMEMTQGQKDKVSNKVSLEQMNFENSSLEGDKTLNKSQDKSFERAEDNHNNNYNNNYYNINKP